jgi:hypothetical protein
MLLLGTNDLFWPADDLALDKKAALVALGECDLTEER